MVELKLSLNEEDIRMLVRLRRFLDDLLETIEVMADEELMKELREALEDVRKGRVMSWEEFLKELEAEEASGKPPSYAQPSGG